MATKNGLMKDETSLLPVTVELSFQEFLKMTREAIKISPWCVTPRGARDSGFGNQGVVIRNLGVGNIGQELEDQALGMTVGLDGRIVVVGSAFPRDRLDTEFALICLEGSVAAQNVPKIAVEEPSGSPISNGGTRDFGVTAIGSSNRLTFEIKNVGTATLSGLAVTPLDTSDFHLDSGPSPTSVPPNGTASKFTLVFSPIASGSRAGTFKVASNDAASNPFVIVGKGTGTGSGAPMIVVRDGGAEEIISGKTYPSAMSVSQRSLVFTLRILVTRSCLDFTGLKSEAPVLVN